MNDVERRLVKVFSESFNEPEAVVTGFEYGHAPQWDSIGHFNLVLAIEEEFDIRLPLAIIDTAKSFTSFLNYLQPTSKNSLVSPAALNEPVHLSKIIQEIDPKNDSLKLVHISVRSFLRNKDGIDTISAEFANEFHSGKGVLVPAFSDTFIRTGAMNWEEDLGNVGILPASLIKQKVGRLIGNPFHRYLYIGAMNLVHQSSSSFGKGSIMDQLLDQDGLIFWVGADGSSFTFAHLVEEALNVPYRAYKTFSGDLKIGSKNIVNYSFEMFSKMSTGFFDNQAAFDACLKEGAIKSASLHGLGFSHGKVRDIHNVLKKKMLSDPHCFFSKNSTKQNHSFIKVR